MDFGFEIVGAKPKGQQTEPATSQAMRVGDKIRRNPSTDQKSVRRQLQRGVTKKADAHEGFGHPDRCAWYQWPGCTQVAEVLLQLPDGSVNQGCKVCAARMASQGATVLGPYLPKAAALVALVRTAVREGRGNWHSNDDQVVAQFEVLAGNRLAVDVSHPEGMAAQVFPAHSIEAVAQWVAGFDTEVVRPGPQVAESILTNARAAVVSGRTAALKMAMDDQRDPEFWLGYLSSLIPTAGGYGEAIAGFVSSAREAAARGVNVLPRISEIVNAANYAPDNASHDASQGMNMGEAVVNKLIKWQSESGGRGFFASKTAMEPGGGGRPGGGEYDLGLHGDSESIIPRYDAWSFEDLYFIANGRNLDVAGKGAPELAAMLRADDSRRGDDGRVASKHTALNWKKLDGVPQEWWYLNPVDVDGRHFVNVVAAGADETPGYYVRIMNADGGEYDADTLAAEESFGDLAGAKAYVERYFSRTGSRKVAWSIDQVRKVVDTQTYSTVDGMTLDLFSASALTQIYDALSPENQAKLQGVSLDRAVSIAFQLAKGKSASLDAALATVHTAAPTAPESGDVVVVAEGGDYYAAKPGDRAVVQLGLYGPGTIGICFRASAFRPDDGAYVSCSGGPLPEVKIEDLKYAGKTQQRFWKWNQYGAGAGNGVDYTLEVDMWEWMPPNRMGSTSSKTAYLSSDWIAQNDHLTMLNGNDGDYAFVGDFATAPAGYGGRAWLEIRNSAGSLIERQGDFETMVHAQSMAEYLLAQRVAGVIGSKTAAEDNGGLWYLVDTEGDELAAGPFMTREEAQAASQGVGGVTVEQISIFSSKTASPEGWWPMAPSTNFPGEDTLACPVCGSTDVTMIGSNLGSDVIMGINLETLRCNSCGNQTTFDMSNR